MNRLFDLNWLVIVQVIHVKRITCSQPLFNKKMFASSAQAHSSVERAGLLGGVQLRLIKADSENRLRGDALEAAIKEDIAAGKIPFYVSFDAVI